jgi:ribosomal-protein-alanine N-acetyltransferase
VSQAVRDSRPGDYEEITALAHARLNVCRSASETQLDFERPKSIALSVASQAGDCVGYAFGWVAGGIAELTEIAMSTEFAGRGCGRELLREFVRRAHQRDAEEVHLEVRVTNAGAIHLYTSEGFKAVGRRWDYYDDGTDAILYSLGLS